MTLAETSTARTWPSSARYSLLCLLYVLSVLACGQADVAPSVSKSTPSNASAEVKPAETEAKPLGTRPVGKELRAADGPALKSITPPDGAVLGGLLNDIAVDLPKPEYPEAAQAENASGTVTVEVVVNERGAVVASNVVSGPQPLWSAAGAAARQARFDPPLKDGKPVKVAGVLTFDFEK
mgnify:FL=1